MKLNERPDQPIAVKAQLGVMGIAIIGLTCGLIGSAIGIYVGGQRASDAAATYLKNTDACSEQALKVRNEGTQMQFAIESSKRQQEMMMKIVDSCIKRGWQPELKGTETGCVNPGK
jgi:acyl CoA:acetate/3-ketoacid CoA transferase alpha subunit